MKVVYMFSRQCFIRLNYASFSLRAGSSTNQGSKLSNVALFLTVFFLVFNKIQNQKTAV